MFGDLLTHGEVHLTFSNLTYGLPAGNLDCTCQYLASNSLCKLAVSCERVLDDHDVNFMGKSQCNISVTLSSHS